MTTCNHAWQWINDWYGDPSIPNGTCHFSYAQCSLCDAIDEEAEKPEPDADYLRDRMMDERAEGGK